MRVSVFLSKIFCNECFCDESVSNQCVCIFNKFHDFVCVNKNKNGLNKFVF